LDLLLLVLQHRGRVAPKELLLRELWADTVVTDASLTRLVKEARRALGDDGRRQRLIKTVRGRGYRFAAVIKMGNGGEIGDGEEERAVELARRSLEAVIERSGMRLRERVHVFVEACQLAIQNARRTNGVSDERQRTGVEITQ
jgi:hypothetical protein